MKQIYLSRIVKNYMSHHYWVLFIFFVFFIWKSQDAQAQSTEDKLTEANNLLLSNNYEQALVIYNAIVNESKDSIRLSYAYSYGGSCYENIDNDSMAINFYKNAILYKTGEYAIFNKLYSLAKKQKDIDNQEFALKAKAKSFPDEKQSCYSKLAYLYAGNRKYDALLNITDQLVKLDSTNSKYYYLKGFALENKGEKNNAELAYTKAVEIDPEDYASNLGLGFLLYNKATVAFDKEQAKYEKIKEPNWRNHMAYMEEIKKVRQIYERARPYLEKACSTKCTDQLKKAIEKLNSRTDQQ